VSDSSSIAAKSPVPVDVALAFFRIGLACLMLRHGIPKLLEFGEHSATFPDPLGVGHATSLVLAIFGEVVCSALLIPGVLVRLTAIPFCITMAVAFLVVHADVAFGEKELAFLYLFGGITILIGGGGRFSVDAWLIPKLRARFSKS